MYKETELSARENSKEEPKIKERERERERERGGGM